MKRLATISLLCTLLFSACKPKAYEKVPENGYFDMPAYIAEVKDSLGLTLKGFNQTITLNGETEGPFTFTTDSTAWADLWKVMRLANPNKPALLGKFSVEQLENEEVYHALDSQTTLRYLSIRLDSSRIHARLREKNPLFETRKNIRFSIDSGMTLQGYQKVFTQEAQVYSIERVWNR